MLLTNREFFTSQLHKLIKRIITSFKIRNIDNYEHNTSKYCELDFYIIETLSNKTSIIAYFKREIYVINNLEQRYLSTSIYLSSKL
jgi:hypothetical protein